MQRPDPPEVDGIPEEPPTAHEPLGDFEILVRLIEHQATYLFRMPLNLNNKREVFHSAIEKALREEGFDLVFNRKNVPGEVPMPDTARLHTAEEMHKPGTINTILASGEFVATLRRELEEAGILSKTAPSTEDFPVVADGSGERALPTQPGEEVAKKVA